VNISASTDAMVVWMPAVRTVIASLGANSADFASSEARVPVRASGRPHRIAPYGLKALRHEDCHDASPFGYTPTVTCELQLR
jgi:hypothetical protein